MTISVIIAAYNEENYIGDCLLAIKKFAPENLKEIIVVNNASTDKTSQVAGEFSGVRVVLEPNKGITKARQRGFTESSGELLAFLDADTRVPEKWFSVLNREFEKNPKLVCLSGPFRYYDLSEHKNWVVRAWNWCAERIARMSGYLVQGGNFVVRRQALEKIGGFDTSIEFYGEDTNIARRLDQVGQLKFTPDFFIYSSGRRLSSEGMVATGGKYLANYLSEVFLKKPATKKYRDFR